jgi:hypothetical protein
MSQKVKHSKIKNTGILFELLTRQLTVDVIDGVDQTKTVKLIKEYFGKNTSLGKELRLYQVLQTEKYSSTDKAHRLIDAVVSTRQKIKNSDLRREKYNLVKSIKENYKIEDFFNARIPNYRMFASIYKLFLVESSFSIFDPKESVESRFTILENITSKKVTPKQKESKVIKEFEKSEKDLRLLSYQIMVDRFNSKYSTLNAPQKNLLRKYISNISNTNSLKEFINVEVVKIKKIISKFLPKIDNKITKIKITEAVKQLDNLTKGRIVRDNQVVSLMRYYEMIKELTTISENKNGKK